MKRGEFFHKIKSVGGAVVASLKEQRVIFAVSVISCIFLCLHIYDLDGNFPSDWNELFFELTLATVMGLLFTIPAAFITSGEFCVKSSTNLQDDRNLQKANISFLSRPFFKYLIQTGAAVAGTVLGFFANRGFGNKAYDSLYFWGIAFAVLLVTVYIFIPKASGNTSYDADANTNVVSTKDSTSTYFAGLIKHFLFSGLMAAILFGGLSLLIFAFQSLIFEFDGYELYGCTGAFCLLVFAVNVFVYYLFYRRQEESSGKAFKVIFLYILLPIFFTLIAVLYIYLFKALILWKLPNGQINWFVSFASCFYIVFYFILREYQNLGVVKVFYKFGAFAFIPLICIQIPAYFIRFNAYGFTGWRFSSLLFIIFSVITIALTFVKKGEFTKYSILLLAGIILFASVTPFNLINSAYKSQYKRMMAVLNKYEMFEKGDGRKSDKNAGTKIGGTSDGKLAEYDKDELNKKITEEDREKLLSSFNYIVLKSSLPLPEWMNSKEYGRPSFEMLFGLNSELQNEDEFFKSYYTINSNEVINIEEFVKMQEIETAESSWGTKNGKYQDYATELPHAKFELDGQTFDITDFLLEERDNSSDGYLWYNLDDQKVLCITNYNYCWNKELGLFRNYNFSGYVFWKLNP